MRIARIYAIIYLLIEVTRGGLRQRDISSISVRVYWRLKRSKGELTWVSGQ